MIVVKMAEKVGTFSRNAAIGESINDKRCVGNLLEERTRFLAIFDAFEITGDLRLRQFFGPS